MRHRPLLLEPGTLATIVSAVLLAAAIVDEPAGAVSSGQGASDTPLYVAAALVGGLYIWWSAAQGVRERDFTADIPVSIATIAAIAIGEFSAAAVVAVLLLAGGLLEEAVAARAGRALESLEALLPAHVTVVRGGAERMVALDEVAVGDLVRVRPGERIAVDGEVQSGRAAVEQAVITGESVPVEKAPGDAVFAGTLAADGALTIEVGSIGQETTLGQIRRLVSEAEERKAPVERVLDRYAKLYTPVAIVLAGILWAISGSATSAITMLIVFCPCVMVLATPTALVASIGNAALRGSLVKQGAAVEAMSTVTAVLFDKTGTLTTGAPRVVDVVALNGVQPGDALALAASAERFSEHPLGRGIVHAANERHLTLHDPARFEAIPGLGVRAVVDGHDVLVGRPRLLAEHGIALGADALASNSGTAVAIAVDDRSAALVTFAEQIRPEAAASIARLKHLGVKAALITGDGERAARRVADGLGIDEVHAGVLPAEKAQIVTRLQDEGHRVAFVGDGVNDGPALASADVGIAMGVVGTDLALETAQVALLSDDLSKLPHLLDLSQRAMRAIRQNLAFSLLVLGVAVALTFVRILQPVSGALLHELSSIPVIANSARLLGTRTYAAAP